MQNKIILLVEDNPDDEELTIMALRENNMTNEVIVAHDGLEALDYLFGQGKYTGRDLSIMPALTLLDLKLPKIGGLELLKRIRGDERTKLLPVVILTSSKEDVDLVAGYSLGCNGYVRKPVSFPEFVEATRQVGLYWLLLNETPPTKGQ